MRSLPGQLVTKIVLLLSLMSPPQGTHDNRIVRSHSRRLAIGLARGARCRWESHKSDCTGLLVYTRDGHMSVEVMYRDASQGTKAATVHSRAGYEAYSGTGTRSWTPRFQKRMQS